jgi:hypothetical protein
MKNKIKIFTISLLIAGTTFISSNISAQTDPPPPPSGHGESGNQAPGGGAPIGSGLFVMIGLGAVYGAKKLFGKNEEE